MPQERDMVRIAEQEEQELRTQLERLGLDPELENYPNYRGTRRYGNADMKRFGVNGDIVLDPTQLELYEMTQRTRALAGLLPEENRRIFLSLLDLNERALACCARGDQLGLGWGILDEMGFADRAPQLKSLVQQKQLELPEKFLSYRSFYVLMAASCSLPPTRKARACPRWCIPSPTIPLCSSIWPSTWWSSPFRPCAGRWTACVPHLSRTPHSDQQRAERARTKRCVPLFSVYGRFTAYTPASQRDVPSSLRAPSRTSRRDCPARRRTRSCSSPRPAG